MKLFILDKIGSDPEFLIQDLSETLVSSIGLIEGDKKKPQFFEDGYAILKDNVLIEGNIPPASNKEEFISNMRMLKELMNIKLMPQGYSLKSDDIGYFTDEQLEDPEANIFGCAGFFNTWHHKQMRAAVITENYRTVGFHIHISYNMLMDNTRDYSIARINEAITRAFDYFVVLPSDKVKYTPERRKSYGSYGSFRDTDYGVECRSLGGFFTHDKYLGWVYDQTVKAIEFASNSDNFHKLLELESPSEENYSILGIELQKQIPETNIKEEKYA